MPPDERHAPAEHDDDGRVSLYPLTFEEALEGLLKVKPDDAKHGSDADEEDKDDGDGA